MRFTEKNVSLCNVLNSLTCAVCVSIMILVIKLVIIMLAGGKGLINPHGPTVVGDFTNCVNQLININFINPGLLVVASSKNVSFSTDRIRTELLKKIHEYSKYAVEVKIPRKEESICGPDTERDEEFNIVHVDKYQIIYIADYYIVIIDTYRDFTYLASRLIRSHVWNPHAKFIVLFFNINDKVIVTNTEKILSCFFKYNVINIVIVVPQETNIRNTIVYSWRPFDPPKFCGYLNETAKDRLVIETRCEKGIVKNVKNVYQNRKPESMEGCVLNILALERDPFISRDSNNPNIEQLLIDQVTAKYGFKTQYRFINSFRGERDHDGNWDGALRKLAAKKSQVLLGGLFPDFDVHEDFECSVNYLADSYAWVVPKAFPSPRWVALLIIFKDTVWFSAIAGFVLCVLSWRVLGALNVESFHHRSLRHCFINVWISTFGFCCYARPVTQSLRVFFIFFNLYCILFLTAYQTKLIDVLTNPKFEDQVDTIEELVTSGFTFGGFEELHDLYINSSDPFDRLIGEKWHDVYNMTTALIDVVKYRNFSVLCSRLELAHMSAIIAEMSDSSGNDKFFVFDKTEFSVPMEMISLRGFAFMSIFSRTLRALNQLGTNAGLRRYFQSFNDRRRANLIRSIRNDNPELDPLSMQHLQGGFLALFLGFVTGSLTLIFEIILNTKFVKNKLDKYKLYFKHYKRM